jgi:hypothetical protein
MIVLLSTVEDTAERSLCMTEIDLQDAPLYRKKVRVRAFLNREAATYFKSWGEQSFPGAHYVIIGPSGEIYGCAVEEFEAMYQAVPSMPDTYRKVTPVRARRMDIPFSVATVTADGNVEVAENRGEAGDWLVQQPGGERQVVPAASFANLYEPLN